MKEDDFEIPMEKTKNDLRRALWNLRKACKEGEWNEIKEAILESIDDNTSPYESDEQFQQALRDAIACKKFEEFVIDWVLDNRAEDSSLLSTARVQDLAARANQFVTDIGQGVEKVVSTPITKIRCPHCNFVADHACGTGKVEPGVYLVCIQCVKVAVINEDWTATKVSDEEVRTIPELVRWQKSLREFVRQRKQQN